MFMKRYIVKEKQHSSCLVHDDIFGYQLEIRSMEKTLIFRHKRQSNSEKLTVVFNKTVSQTQPLDDFALECEFFSLNVILTYFLRVLLINIFKILVKKLKEKNYCLKYKRT